MTECKRSNGNYKTKRKHVAPGWRTCLKLAAVAEGFYKARGTNPKRTKRENNTNRKHSSL